jgi:hypothetical protein
LWLPRGKDILLVYSQSDMARIHDHTNPSVGARACHRLELVTPQQVAAMVFSGLRFS